MTQTVGNVNSFSVLLSRKTWDSEIKEERSYKMEELSPNSFGVFLYALLYILVIFLSASLFANVGVSHIGSKLDLRTSLQK